MWKIFKETWKGINSILSKAKISIKIPKIVVNGSEISDPEAISNAFNEYFAEIGPNLAAQIPTNTSSAVDNINRNNLVFELHEVSTVQISRLVDKLSICKASGLDNISVRLLKSSAPTIIPSLTYIINLVICKGIIPADWKSARVSASYKNDSKLDLNNQYQFFRLLQRFLRKLCSIKPTIFSTTTIFYLKSSLVSDTFILD